MTSLTITEITLLFILCLLSVWFPLIYYRIPSNRR